MQHYVFNEETMYVDEQGYPRFKRSKMLVHRWVMSKKKRRKLKPEEVVHHIDGNKMNFHPKNLKLFRNRETHHAHHNWLERNLGGWFGHTSTASENIQCDERYLEEDNNSRDYSEPSLYSKENYRLHEEYLRQKRVEEALNPKVPTERWIYPDRSLPEIIQRIVLMIFGFLLICTLIPFSFYFFKNAIAEATITAVCCTCPVVIVIVLTIAWSIFKK